MANPVAYNRAQSLQRSFNLLCEYLNFGNDPATGGTAGPVKRVLRSPFVRPFFDEYKRDYLMKADEIEDIEFHGLQSFCSEKGAFKSAKYSRRGPVDKAKWGAFDHAARYMVQTLQYSWGKIEGPWDQGEWDPESDDGDVEFWQVWMILRHLQAEWEARNLEDWDGGSLEEMFKRHSLKETQ